MRSTFRNVLFILFVGGPACCLAQGDENPASANDALKYDTAGLSTLMQKAKALVYQYPDSALRYLTKAIALSEKQGVRESIAEGQNWAGVAHYVKGEYDHALQLFVDAQHIYRQTQNHYGLSTCYNHIGLIYQTQQRYDKAIAYHRKGIHHGKAIGSLDRQAPNHFNIGLAYDETGQYDSALYYLRICLDQSRRAGLHRLIIMSFNRIGKVNFHLGAYAAAKSLYDSVLNYPPYQNNWETCFALAGLAEVYNALGSFDKAIASGIKSLSIAREISARWDIVHAAEILSQAYANNMQFEQAYRTALIAHAYKDSLFSEEKENKLNYIHLKENELAKANLEKVNALQSVKLKQRNFQVSTAVVVSVSMLVILCVLYSRHRQKSRLNKQLRTTNQKIEQQNNNLNELNQAKNQLLSIISHDLRGPFGNLQALLSLVRSGRLERDDQEKLFGQLEQTFLSVSGTLDNLLQWTQSQMEGLKTAPGRLDVDEVIDQTHAFWQPAIIQKEIAYRSTRRNLQVYADRYHLQTVIRNILGNAIKFTQPGGSIMVETLRKDDKVGIIISDTGMGIPPAIRDSLFTFEKKNQRPGTHMEKGSGLGLAISYQLLQKNGGDIEVESEEGKGTTFTLWVPSG